MDIKTQRQPSCRAPSSARADVPGCRDQLEAALVLPAAAVAADPEDGQRLRHDRDDGQRRQVVGPADVGDLALLAYDVEHIADDAGKPLVSITTSALRPPVRSRIACRASVSTTLMQSVAPYARDTANGASRASVTIRRRCVPDSPALAAADQMTSLVTVRCVARGRGRAHRAPARPGQVASSEQADPASRQAGNRGSAHLRLAAVRWARGHLGTSSRAGGCRC
jgi:hypothetical protein